MRVIAAVGLLPEAAAGPERMIASLVRALLDLDADTDPQLRIALRAVTLRNGDVARAAFARIDPRAEVAVSTLPQRLLGPAQSRLRLPPERWLAGRYDAYHQFHLDADPAVPDRRLVVTVNDVVAARWPGVEGYLSRYSTRLVRRAARVVTPSAFSRDAAIAEFGLDPARVDVVPNGVDHTRFTPDGPRRGGEYLLYVGGATPRKNVPRVLETLAALRASGRPELRLVLAGPVNAHADRLRAEASHDAAALDFVGHVSDDGLAELYRGARALIFPSLHEGFGLPVLEAMSCGTPVVTSAGTSLPEVGGEAAVYVDPADTDSIAAGVESVLTADDAARERRRRVGIAHAATFGWDVAAAALRTIYRDVAG